MRVKQVEYVNEYKLKLLFSDKKTKIVDLAEIIKKGGYYFDPLKDIEFFKQVSLDDEEYPLSIRWPNEADLCPDVLYEMGVDIPEEKKPAPKIQRNYAKANRLPKKRKSVAKIKQKIA